MNSQEPSFQQGGITTGTTIPINAATRQSIVDQYREAVQLLESEIELLEGQLGAVLRPDYDESKAVADHPKPVQAFHRDTLDYLQTLIGRLAALRARLEV